MHIRNYAEEIRELKSDAARVINFQISDLHHLSASGRRDEILKEIERFNTAMEELAIWADREGRRWTAHSSSDYGFKFIDEITVYP